MIGIAAPAKILLNLAVQAVSPVVGGCARALAAQSGADINMGHMVGESAERAVEFFGRRIAEKWAVWLESRPRHEREKAISDLAAVPADAAREECRIELELAGLDAELSDKLVALDYLAAIPPAVRRSLALDRRTGQFTVPATVKLDDRRDILKLLPTALPPYSAPCELPGTPYRLEELLGQGGFGSVYRAVNPDLPHLGLAIKVCSDAASAESLRLERANLERLIRDGGGDWSPRVVRLYGYNTEHATPFLVSELVRGGDLAGHVARVCAGGVMPDPDQVFAWISGLLEALAFVHERGLVHRDLKPANVLLDTTGVKLADLGIGGVRSDKARAEGRIGTLSANQLRIDEQLSLMRGSGTPAYMSPEQKRGDAPDPRHDMYSLGVVWYQLLLGDCGRELSVAWADELADEAAPPEWHVAAIRKCLGLMRNRPASAATFLNELRKPEPIEPLILAPTIVPEAEPVWNRPASAALPTPRGRFPAEFVASLLELRDACREAIRPKAIGRFDLAVVWAARLAIIYLFVTLAAGPATGPPQTVWGEWNRPRYGPPYAAQTAPVLGPCLIVPLFFALLIFQWTWGRRAKATARVRAIDRRRDFADRVANRYPGEVRELFRKRSDMESTREVERAYRIVAK